MEGGCRVCFDDSPIISRACFTRFCSMFSRFRLVPRSDLNRLQFVCCECPQHISPTVGQQHSNLGYGQPLRDFDVCEKRVFFPDMVFGTKFIFRLTENWLRIMGCLWDMLCTSCQGGDTINWNQRRLRLGQGQQNKPCLSKFVKLLIFRKGRIMLLLSRVAKGLRTRTVLEICGAGLAGVATP